MQSQYPIPRFIAFALKPVSYDGFHTVLRLFLLLILFWTPLATSADLSALITQAQANSVQAQYALGLEYQQGQNTTRSLPDAFYWFEKAAQQGHSKAMEQVAEAYLYGLGTDKNPQQAVFWLTKLALLGQTAAQTTLADYYQKLGAQRIDAQDLAQLWYHIASEKDPQAEEKYTQILEDKFNQQRARQVASIKQLEQAIPDANPSSATSNNSQQMTTNESGSNGDGSVASDYLLLVCLLILLFALVWSANLWRRRNQQKEQYARDEKHAQQHQANEQQKQLKKQKQQLETLFHEVQRLQGDKQKLTALLTKKMQASAPPPPPAPNAAAQNLALACALLGFNPAQIPDEKAIKLRYKQLSKIYHPDMKGTEEEMKRLNGAVKLVMAQRKK